MAGLPVLLFLKKNAGGDKLFWEGRLGSHPPCAPGKNSLKLWFHAASVGEVTGAAATLHAVKERFPNACIYLSVGTVQGFRFARAQLPSWVTVIPFPLDFPWILQKTFRALQPDLYVGLEGEFWPNLLHTLQQRKIPAVLLNGRLSSRSARRFARFSRLLGPLASHFSTLAMLTEDDRQNLLSLGIPRERTRVLGSSKYDALARRVDPNRAAAWHRLLRLDNAAPVIVGGSLRRSECTQLLEVFEALRREAPRAVGLFAPRHMEQIPPMVRWLEDRKIAHHRLSDLEKGHTVRREPIVLVDRIGILFELYGTGDLIFCGGTLEPIGGHNILEPAAWGKAVFYGPHLQKVQAEHKMLHSLEGSFMARDAADLLESWLHWMKDLRGLESHGSRAREALSRLGGVTERHLEIIEAALQGASGTGTQTHGKD